MALERGNTSFKYQFHKVELIAILCIGTFPILLETARQLITGAGEAPLTWVSLACHASYSFAATFSLYFVASYLFQWLNFHYPWEQGIWKRLWREVVFLLSLAAIVQFALVTLFALTPLYGFDELSPQMYFENYVFGTAITIIAMSIFEGVYLFRNWRQSLVEKEQLEKENLKSQLGNLKAQLDPHFMFNSLNTLSSLIQKDPKKAEEFLEDFTKVYRYILEIKDEMVVSLNQELKFVDAYIGLQKIRFGKALKISQNIEVKHLGQYIAPLSLQETIGNAIKHNEASVERPLHINVQSNGSGILVKNNLQLRQDKGDSIGVGLDNLTKRYEILSQQKPTFIKENGDFVAWIPLIEEA